MTPSDSFVRTLQAMDPLLSVRWGPHVYAWVVQRKAVLPETEVFYLRRRAERLTRRVNAGTAPEADKETLKGVLEELICAEDGKRVILFAPALTDKIYNQLCLADITKYGGYSRYADLMEQREAAKEADRERQQSEWNIARNKEAAGVLRFLEDRRSTALAHGGQTIAQMLGTKDYLPKSLPKHLYDPAGRVAKEL
jgi:hypothetical protein